MKLNRIFKKDRYQVVRGGIFIGVLILVCSILFAGIVVRRDVSFESERASLAAQQAAVRLEQLIHEKMKLMDDAAANLNAGNIDLETALDELKQQNVFDSAAVEAEGMFIYGDQQSEPASQGQKYPYVEDGCGRHSFIMENGTIQIRAELDRGRVLAAWIKPDQIEEILAGAIEGEYPYAVFNVDTGAYLINATSFTHGGYYDILRKINDKGQAEMLMSAPNAQAHIEYEGKTYCAAQRSLTVQPIGIAFFFPQELLGSVALNGSADTVFVIACTVALICALAAYVFIINRRIGIANRNASRALDVSDRLVDIISSDANITACICQGNGDRILSCYDGLKLFEQKEGIVRATSISDFGKICGMADGEIERIYDRVSELKAGENAEIIVQCFRHVDEEYLLRFSFHVSEDNSRNVICTISDCTQEQEAEDRAEREYRYQSSIQNKTSSIWQVNVTRNRWRLLHSKRKNYLNISSLHPGEQRNYSDDLNGKLREYLHAKDHDAFVDALSLSSIAAAFRSGKAELSLDYRVHRKKPGEYKWHRIHARIWLDAKTNDVIANLYVFNVDAEKRAEIERGERKRIMQQTLTALGGMYYGLYYVDLEKDLCYTARSLSGELVDQLARPYKATFEGFVNEFVHPDEQAEMHKKLSAYMLRKSMTEGSHHQKHEYRRKVSDDTFSRAAMIIQPARFENATIKEVVIAVQYIGGDEDLKS